MKRTLIGIGAVIVIILAFIGGFALLIKNSASNKTVTVGIMSGTSQEDEIWALVAQNAKQDYGITVKTKKFTDYNQPNEALSNGDIQLNAFQHYAFLNTWNKDHTNQGGKTPVSIGDTVLTPIRLYSKKITNLNDLQNGATIAVPNDASNEGRALFLLESAGLITLKSGVDTPTVKDIATNSKNLQIKELAADQVARSLQDVDAAVINTNYAQAANIDLNSAIYVEPQNDRSKLWNNLIAAKQSDQNNTVLKEVVKSYQKQNVADKIKELYGGAEVAVWSGPQN